MLAWEKDGVEISVALLRASDGYAFVINGKADGSSRGDAATQVMGGLIGAAAPPRPAPGAGDRARHGIHGRSGSPRCRPWSAWTSWSSSRRSCASPATARRSITTSSPIPGSAIWIGDAREWLLTSREKYDVIFSEPSNPYRAGISSLFTADFYRAARSRLAPGGIFLQWLQAYEVDSGTVLTVYATLGSVFPEVETWHTKQSDLILAATAEPIAYDGSRLRGRLRQEPYVSALRDAWRVSDLEGFLSHYVARPSLTRTLVSSARTPSTPTTPTSSSSRSPAASDTTPSSTWRSCARRPARRRKTGRPCRERWIGLRSIAGGCRPRRRRGGLRRPPRA